jgi:1-deoxy-D-xylulose-5-phosphate reductoisomerase
LVCAGGLILQTAENNNARILPVDSEHSAIFQGLVGEDMSAVERIIITASGGAFRDWPIEDLANATLAQASAHPNWDMGQRITIDSASMFNKAMEVIETHEYFDVCSDQIEVLVHPESMIHALVGFKDGALMAHVGPPDMRHAIGYALHWPERQTLPVERLDLAKIGSFTFRAPEEVRWPALRLAREVMARGGLAGAVFNAAKETALDGFISGALKFIEMSEIVDQTLFDMDSKGGHIDDTMTLDNVLYVDHLARRTAQHLIKQRAG